MPLTEAVKDGFSRYLPFRPPTLPSSSPPWGSTSQGCSTDRENVSSKGAIFVVASWSPESTANSSHSASIAQR